VVSGLNICIFKMFFRLSSWSLFILLFLGTFCSTGVWIQGLYLELLHQPFFVIDFFQARVSQTFCPGWLQILLISASWVARITSMSHRCSDIFRDMLSLCSTGLPHTDYLPPSVSWVLKLQACTTMCSLTLDFCVTVLYLLSNSFMISISYFAASFGFSL
jgi:hypothetical protein